MDRKIKEIVIINKAKKLGIKLTAAELGTALYQAWADSVEQAAMHSQRKEMNACQTMINEANRYAI